MTTKKALLGRDWQRPTKAGVGGQENSFYLKELVLLLKAKVLDP